MIAEENTYLVSLVKAGDMDAANELIKLNEGLVRELAYRYANMFELIGPDFGIVSSEILIELGHSMLIEAAKRYDESNDASFYTFAYTVVKNAFRGYCRKKLRLVENQFSLSGKRIVYLDEVMPESDDLRSDYIIDSDVGFVSTSIEYNDPVGREAFFNIKCRHLYMALDKLPDHQRLIVTYLYGLADTEYHTYEETAKRYNTTKKYVMNQEKKALEALRDEFNEWE